MFATRPISLIFMIISFGSSTMAGWPLFKQPGFDPSQSDSNRPSSSMDNRQSYARFRPPPMKGRWYTYYCEPNKIPSQHITVEIPPETARQTDRFHYLWMKFDVSGKPNWRTEQLGVFPFGGREQLKEGHAAIFLQTLKLHDNVVETIMRRANAEHIAAFNNHRLRLLCNSDLLQNHGLCIREKECSLIPFPEIRTKFYLPDNAKWYRRQGLQYE